MSRPTLSVCIPNYNMAQWVTGAIDSALAQEPADLVEVVVVDNASTDNSRQLLERYRGIPRLRIGLADDHLPMADNWNRAVRASSGEWCVVLCADDELLPSFASNLMALAGDEHNLAVTQMGLGLEGDPPRLAFRLGDTLPRTYEGSTGILDLLPGNVRHVQNPFPLSSTAFRREAFERTGGFHREVAGLAADWDLWFRLVALGQGKAVATGVPGARIYRDRGSTWKRAMEDANDIELIGHWLDQIRPHLARWGLERRACINYAWHAIFAIFSRTDASKPEQIAAQLRVVGPILQRLGVGTLGARHIGRTSIHTALDCASVSDWAAAKSHLRTAIQQGSNPWRWRAAAELLLLSTAVGVPLARWRVSEHPVVRIVHAVRAPLPRRWGPMRPPAAQVGVSRTPDSAAGEATTP